jgi:hypothetical protein
MQIQFFVESGMHLDTLERSRVIVRYSLAALENLGSDKKYRPGECEVIVSILTQTIYDLRDPSLGLDRLYKWFWTLHETSTHLHWYSIFIICSF